MRKTLLFSLLLLQFSWSSAQFSLPYKLGSNTDFAKLCSGYDLKSVEELEVLDERTVEYAYDKDNNLFEYFYIHEIRYVNSNDAIDRSNKIYISLARTIELIGYDVRVVLANGKVNSMGEDALKEGTNEDNQKVNFFAVSGAEKGSFIEYYYLIKRNPSLSGTIQTFQANAPKARVLFKIISPENLFFSTKSLNGFPEMREDTTLEERNMLVADTAMVPKMFDESFANEDGSKQKVIYQLYFNTAKGKKNPYNYGLVSQNIYDNLCNNVTKEENKAIEKILKSANIKYAPDEETKIRSIEGYVKKNFNFNDINDSRLSNIETIVQLGAMNENGAARMFCLLFDKAGIEKEIVVTSSRFKTPFPKDYESYVFLNNFLIYFPSINKYMSPFSQTFRLGLVPGEYTENYGLYIRKVSLGDINTGAGKVKFIAAYPATTTQNNMTVKVNMNKDFDSLDIDLRQEFLGYNAQNFQPYFEYIDKDKLREYEENIVRQFQKEISIKSIKIENKGSDNLMLFPLIVNSKSSSQHFIEKAGPKILLKFGELIGPQSELYQASARILPVENAYNRTYHREITFTIPEGYQVKNLAELNMKVQPFLGKNDAAGFTSTYTQEGNTIKLVCDEYYNVIHLPLETYESYRSVINAAANFNKIVLVLEKL